MPSLTVVGDASTTTALALSSSWPGDDTILVELDPSGGSLAAWLDVPVTPSLSSIVAAIRRGGVGSERAADPRSDDPWTVIDSMTRRAPGGLRFVPSPFTRREAARAVGEAHALLVPTAAARTDVTTIFDLGRVDPGDLPEHVAECDACLLVHRQERSSPRAAAVRLERFAELVEHVDRRRAPIRNGGMVIGVVGDRPFEPAEIAAHVGVRAVAEVVTIADDPVAAAVLAGRPGMSVRRLQRQPLLRAARRAAARLEPMIAGGVTVGPGVTDGNVGGGVLP